MQNAQRLARSGRNIVKIICTDSDIRQEIGVEVIPATKRGPGRPAQALGPGAQHVQVNLDPELKAFAKKLGGGVIGAGVRIALQLAMQAERKE